ncbi:MAG: dienelactone hydrolase family protein [Anaerolineales bacterium]|nr:dienelactone hydrolase family protein [Anaerolineales bacterium]
MQPDVLHAGESLNNASAVMILVHGRGSTAQDILSLGQSFVQPGLAFLAPQAPNYSWYPYSFLSPLDANQPYLDNALTILGNLFMYLESLDIPSQYVLLMGFSQGACLSLEFAARNARRFGGVVGLSGGLIGPPGIQFSYPGSFDATPVFLGCSNPDPHIPVERVHETDRILEKMFAKVTKRIYPNLGHTINDDEIDFIRRMISDLPKRNSREIEN